MPGPFWHKPLEMTGILDVGLRSGYVASWHAAPMMVAQGRGLIVFTSSFGANCYMHGPAYGAQKAGIDKFAHDMAVDLRPYGVAAVSLWMGPLRTARTMQVWEKHPDKYASFAPVAETPEFTGRIIDALHRDPALMDKSGKVLICAEAALAYGIVDAEGVQPPSYRQALGGAAGGASGDCGVRGFVSVAGRGSGVGMGCRSWCPPRGLSAFVCRAGKGSPSIER